MTPSERAPRSLPARFPIRSLPLLLALAAGSSAQEGSAFRYWNPRDTASAPKTLSAMNLYRQTPGKGAELIPEAHPYEVNSPAWYDGARTKRWVLLKPGLSIGYREQDDSWGYPDSTVFIQELSIDTNALDTNSRVLWETRVLVNAKEDKAGTGVWLDHWYGYSYRWRKDESDADRVNPRFGMHDSIRVWPQGVGPGKPFAMQKRHFPSIYQCDQCHQQDVAVSDSAKSRGVLGFFTAQLNRPYPGAGPTLNQLEFFFRQNLLSGPRSDWEAAPHWRGLEDSAFTANAWTGLDIRARSYIAAYCSGCHGYRGMRIGAAAGVTCDFDFHTMAPRMEMRGAYISYPFGLDTVPPLFYAKNDPGNPGHLDTLRINPALVVAGHPEKSLLLLNMQSRAPEAWNYDAVPTQMPLLDTYLVDTLAVKLLTRWIKEMPLAQVQVLAPLRHASAPNIRLQGRLLRVDAPGPGRNADLELVSLTGSKVALRRVGSGVYEIPAVLPKGVYLAHAGTRSTLLSLF
jgi:hypothetical protein